MHYANGRAAKVGDLVRGKGYNLKHEFTGVLLSANPATTACNCTIATITAPPSIQDKRYSGSGFFGTVQPASDGTGWKLESSYPNLIMHTVEHGQLDAFVAIDPNSGELLPPDPPAASSAVIPISSAASNADNQSAPLNGTSSS
jgi:hypothetical protein